MIGASDALASDFFGWELAIPLFWAVNAAWVMVVLYGMIVHRSFAVGCLFAGLWALTLCLYVAVPLLTTIRLTLADSFFLLAVIMTGVQAIFDLSSAFGLGKSQNGGGSNI